MTSQEIVDKISKELLAFLPFVLQHEQPSEVFLSFVCDDATVRLAIPLEHSSDKIEKDTRSTCSR